MEAHEVPPIVLDAWELDRQRLTPVTTGLINRTFFAERGGSDGDGLVLQRLHPVFRPEVNLDIEAITAHLDAQGVPTPSPVRTTDGALWVAAEDGPWRVLTRLEGRVPETVRDASMAAEAGRVVGRFHRALEGFEHEFHFTRPGAHDAPRHLAHLETALDTHPAHPLRDGIAPLAATILAHGARLPDLGDPPRRIVHGDLKITNVLFDAPLERGVALIDLDTMAHGTLPVEMGDALRSWCNPAGEEAASAEVDPTLFEASLRGYGETTGGILTRSEREALVAGLETIALELAARFCADALEERYFGWDPARFASRAHHNLVRARSQASLAASVRARRAHLEQIAERVLAGTG